MVAYTARTAHTIVESTVCLSWNDLLQLPNAAEIADDVVQRTPSPSRAAHASACESRQLALRLEGGASQASSHLNTLRFSCVDPFPNASSRALLAARRFQL